jgi:hypothetical protein
MNTEHGHIRIVKEVPLNYGTQAEIELAKRYGIKAFECEGTCRECEAPIYPVLGCKKCEEDQMCEPHARHKYCCGKCAY